MKTPSPSARKTMRTISYGLAGNMAATSVVFSHTGRRSKAAGHVGAGLGVALGTGVESALGRRKRVKEQQASHGDGVFQIQVGTKTNGRVGKKDHPYAYVGGGK